MGVDCVPVYRMEAPDAAEQAAEVTPAPTMQASPTAARQPAPEPSRVVPREQKAAAPAAQQASAPALAPPAKPAAKRAGTSAEAFTFSPPPRAADEDERAYRTRALASLRARYEEDAPHNQFVTAFTNIVFDDGDPCANLCFVGEAPGAEEDLQGKPFVGRSGELLNKMIVGMGLSRERVYICNVLKTRPPDNATPTTREIDICRPYLLAQLAIVRPKAIVTLGLPAAQALLRSTDTMARLRSNWATLSLRSEGDSPLLIPVMPTYHPAYLLRAFTPENRAKVWSDLCLVLKHLGMPIPTKGSTGANP